MLNSGYRKESIERLEKKVKEHDKASKSLVLKSVALFEERNTLKLVVEKAYDYINEIRNKPVKITIELRETEYSLNNYSNFLKELDDEISTSTIKAGGNIAASAVAGAGVAALGPAAAMGIATTFGTASTGAAISGLSGAAATNAALAWLGGGTLAAGGGGMTAGSAFLALAGPIGWGVAGVGILSGGLLMNSKNKKIAMEANKKALEVEGQLKVTKGLIREINKLIKITKNFEGNLIDRTPQEGQSYKSDYLEMTDSEKFELGTMVNILSSAVESFTKVPGDSLKK